MAADWRNCGEKATCNTEKISGFPNSSVPRGENL
jgi:hypothetical protein